MRCQLYIALISARFDYMQLFLELLLVGAEIGQSRYLSRLLGVAHKYYINYAGCVRVCFNNVQWMKQKSKPGSTERFAYELSSCAKPKQVRREKL